jgi:hypothetical protein
MTYRDSLTRVRRGNVTCLVAILLVPLMGMLAFCLDGGSLLDKRRRSQTVADLAALAAATDLFTNYNKNQGKDVNNSAKNSALNNAKANGFDNQTNNTVTVHLNPSTYQGGQWQGQTIPVGYVEVIVTYSQPRYFSAIWGQGTLKVQARAVSRASFTAASPGILILDPTGKGSLTANGNGSIVVKGGGSIVVDSNNAAGGVITGHGNIQASAFYFSGTPGYTNTSQGNFVNPSGNFDSSIMHSGVPPTPDPLANLPVPTMPGTALLPNGAYATSAVNWSGNNAYGAVAGVLTLSPGTYNGGIQASGGAAIILQPGIYYMNGGGFVNTGSASITVAGPASPATGTGVLLYNAPLSSSDSIQITGNGSTTLPAPTLGTYQGISIFQARSSNAPISITGNGTMNIGGTFYAAGATLNIVGNGSFVDGVVADSIGAQYISKDLVVTGNGSFQLNYSGGNPINVRTIQLVE